MKETILKFFSWAFEDKPQDQFIIVCAARKFIKDGKEIGYFAAYNCESPEKAAEITLRYSSKREDMYYTLTTYTDNIESVERLNGMRSKVSREAKYARMARIIGFDIDCGENKPYPSWEEGIAVAVQALTQLGLSAAQYTLIKSGGGVHGYIKLTEFINKQEWIRYATALKAFFAASKVQIDRTKINEAAMLLRPVGTYNFKKPEARLVEIIHQNTVNVSPETLEILLKAYLPLDQTAIEFNVSEAYLPSAVIDSSAIEGVLKSFKPSFLAVQKNCKQMDMMAQNAQVSEALWYATLGVAAYTETPDEAAVAWSKSDGRFSKEQTLKKMDQWVQNTTGPATCAQLNQLNPYGCVSCPFSGKIKTPLQSVSAPVVAVKGAEDEVFDLPPNYKVVGDKIVQYNEDLERDICDYLIYLDDVARLYHIRTPITYLRIKVNLPRIGWTPIEIELGALTGATGKGRESFASIMGNLGVVLQKKQMICLQEYILDCFKHYQRKKDMNKVIVQMGWTTDGAFVYGTKELKGSIAAPERVIPQGNAVNTFAPHMKPMGDKSTWLEMLTFLSNPGLEKIAFGYLLGYASILFKFTGLHGATVNFYSPESGSGKTTAPRLAMSIFTHPDKLTAGIRDTDAYIYSKLSSLQNIPYFIDEVTNVDGVRASNIIYMLSEGRDRGRADVEGQAKEEKHWDLLLLTSSNASLYDKLDATRACTAGEKARFIELTLSSNELVDKHGKALNLLINENHGHGAIPFLDKVVDLYKQGILINEVQNAVINFERHFKFSFQGEERFISSILGCTWYAAKLASDLGLCPAVNGSFDLDRIFNIVLNNIKQNRAKLTDAVEDATSLLNVMLARSTGSWIKVVHYPTDVNPSYSMPGDSLHGRIEIQCSQINSKVVPVHGTICVSEDALKKFCFDTGRPYHKYIDEFRTFRNFKNMYINLTSGIKTDNFGHPVIPIRLKCFIMDVPINTLEMFHFDKNRKDLSLSTSPHVEEERETV